MESAKLRALLYADIFDYPLTRDELEKWGIIDGQLSTLNFQFSTINRADGYYFLKEKKHLIDLRKKREKISQYKFKKAQAAASLLGKIPFVKLVAITGNLAMKNCKREDDIDLLIIGQRGTLWLTRFLATILLDLVGIRRKPNDKKVSDRICLNMFLEDGYLALPKDEQDLYGAHEVCQLKPLFDKNNTYLRFLKANSWVKKFLPKAMVGIRKQELGIMNKKPFSLIPDSLFIIPELVAKFFQLLFMKRHRTTEVIASHMLRFHPKDYRKKILNEYQKRLKRYD